MKRPEELHIDEKLQAWLDGELPRSEAEELERHVERCARCCETLEEAKAVLEALRSDGDAEPLHSMWPAVRARIAPGGARRFGFAFGVATSLAAAAGLIIGMALGSTGDLRQSQESVDSAYTEVSLVGDDSLAGLDEIYVSAFDENGGSER
jgi:anti-sigma factor RsiW